MGKKSRKKRDIREGRLQSHTQHTPPLLPSILQTGETGNPNRSLLRRGLNKAWTAFAGVGIILSVVQGFLYFAPELAVVPSDASLSNSPLDTIFTVKNVGNIDLRDVRFYCRINHAKLKNGNQFAWGVTSLHIKQLHTFTSHDSTNLPCLTFLHFQDPLTIDISFIITFRPSWLMFSKGAQFRFRTVQTPSGLKWIQEAITN